jgi:hypothetical protein
LTESDLPKEFKGYKIVKVLGSGAYGIVALYTK